MEKVLKIAIAQCPVQDGSISANIESVIFYIEAAAQKGVDLIVFPEKFLTGYIPNLIEANIEKYTFQSQDSRLEPIRQCCNQHKIIALIGAPTRLSNKIYVSTLIFQPFKEEEIYHKNHLYHTEIPLFYESKEAKIITVKGWKIGLGICYDTAFPEHISTLAQRGCHAYVASSLFSKGNGYKESRLWFPIRAKDNHIFTVMSNHVGFTGGWETCGSSAAWNPKGELIKEASPSGPELLLVNLDAKEFRSINLK